MNSVEEFYHQLYNLSYITRYSVVPRIKDESVAEHSFYVASIVVKLYDDYNFDLGKAVAMAVIHDWTESWVDDVTVATKRAFPYIAEAVKIAEKQVVLNNFSATTASLWFEHEAKQSVESLIVHYADVIQCMQYSGNELKLGNDGYMKEVFFMSGERAKELKELLNEFKR